MDFFRDDDFKKKMKIAGVLTITLSGVAIIAYRCGCLSTERWIVDSLDKYGEHIIEFTEPLTKKRTLVYTRIEA